MGKINLNDVNSEKSSLGRASGAKPGLDDDIDEKPNRFKSHNLHRFSAKVIIPKAIGAIVILLLVVFFGRVGAWEKDYYARMEGSERAVTESAVAVAASSTEVDETEVTEQEKAEYIVAADRPRYLTIDKLGIYNSRIIPVGVTAEGRMDVPNNIYDVGWYTGSNEPGQGGTMLIAGHNGGPNVIGVLKYLPSLQVGDLIRVERGDGRLYTYSVVENRSVPLSEADAEMATMLKSPIPGKESISIISCTGEWSQVQYTYLSRQFLRAVLVSD